MRKLWKTTATLAAAVLLAGSLAGCGSSGGSSSSSGGGKSGSTSDMIVTTMNTEAGSLDSAGESGLWWWSYDDVCMAPIMEMKEDGSWDYILAESVDVNEDMTQYTVHLRSRCKMEQRRRCDKRRISKIPLSAHWIRTARVVIPQCFTRLRELRKCTTEPRR